MYRQQGQKLRYAQPPPGTYASTQQSFQSPQGPGQYFQPQMGPPSAMGPPTAVVPPTSMSSGSFVPSAPPQPPPPLGTQLPPPRRESGTGSGMYHPVQHHWCYSKQVENKEIWFPFTLMDSIRLEEAFQSRKYIYLIKLDLEQ